MDSQRLLEHPTSTPSQDYSNTQIFTRPRRSKSEFIKASKFTNQTPRNSLQTSEFTNHKSDRRRASTLFTNLASYDRSAYVQIEEQKESDSVTSDLLSIYDEYAEDESRSISSVTLVEEEIPSKAEITLPGKRHTGFIRRLRWSFVTVYHRLNLMIVIPNLLAMVALAAQSKLLSEPHTLLLAVSVNVTISIMIRQDHIINMLFWIFGEIPHSTPLFLRRLATKLYHLGGIHSGAGMAATLWFGCFTVALLKAIIEKPERTTLDFAMVFVTLLMICLLLQILITSHPRFRDRWHNTWERVHRFAGWLMLVLFWLHFLINVASEHETDPTQPMPLVIFTSPSFYLLLASTGSIVLPWCALYQASVTPERLSKHAIRLHFSYASIGPCKTPRFADSPATEWHSFASIPNPEGPGFSVIVSRAGDWTSRVIDTPPTQLWTRGTPARGALYMAKLFRKVVLVATGSGIAPILGAVQIPGTQFRLLWSAPDPETTFTQVVPRLVRDADPHALIWDTKQRGRPDLVQEAYRMYVESGAEAVFIISNAKVTEMFVYALESRGVPTFAPIFDS